MKKQMVKRTAAIVGSIALLLIVVLCAHVYAVTNRPPVGPQRVMARIDFKQDINADDVTIITKDLYTQAGVDHVLCNDAANIAVFTFSPGINTADNIVKTLIAHTGYKAQRYVPAKDEMMKGCPVAVSSFTDKIQSIYRSVQIFPQLKKI